MRNSVLYETKYWTVILTDDQYNLGRCYIKVKRECPSFSELTKEEYTDFHENVVKKLEPSIKELFGAVYFNWECLLNNDYKGEGRIPHLRLHFRPRYKEEIEFEGETFNDEEFGEKYILEKEKMVSDEVFNKIKDVLLQKISFN